MKNSHHMRICLLVLLSVAFTQSWSQKNNTVTLSEKGRFFLGCNYWASHAGTNMWCDWKYAEVEQDFRQISEAGMQVIRVFPLWPDFQPIYQYYSGGGSLKEVRFKDRALGAAGPEKDGVSLEALDHFRQLADLAQKYNIKLVVGLVTGWMSGQLFVPPALEGKDILTDPTSIMWQVKLVRTMVREFKNHPAILAWDLGNECNVMGPVGDYQAAYVWTASVANAIKAEDTAHPVVSGMHSLSSDSHAKWRIWDQAELTDVLTTHPYPFWVEHANLDPANTIRTIMHSAAETRLYSDIGGKPCMVEEVGIMGPLEANDKNKSAFLRSILFNNWAHGNYGLMWWCAYDQNHLQQTPYEWYAVERDLGLFRTDRSQKPMIEELMNFRKFLDGLPFESLPERKKEAVCILTDGQDQWGVAYSTFILAKQAGFDVEFQHGSEPLKEAPVYIMPSIKGLTLINRTDWLALLDKVKAGATLYVSFDEGFLSHFVENAGIDVQTGQNRTGQVSFVSTDGSIKPFSMNATRRLNIVPTTARVLAKENDGNPVFTENTYGKGMIYFLSFPLEMDMTNTPGIFTENPPECWKIYKAFGSAAIARNRTVTKSDPLIGITEHDLSSGRKIITIINYTPAERNVRIEISGGWSVEKCLYGKMPLKSSVLVQGNDACVLEIQKN